MPDTVRTKSGEKAVANRRIVLHSRVKGWSGTESPRPRGAPFRYHMKEQPPHDVCTAWICLSWSNSTCSISFPATLPSEARDALTLESRFSGQKVRAQRNQTCSHASRPEDLTFLSALCSLSFRTPLLVFMHCFASLSEVLHSSPSISLPDYALTKHTNEHYVFPE